MVDSYKVGVSLVLANGVSSVAGIIAKDLLGLKNITKDIENGFSAWPTKLKGVVAVLGAAGILGAMVDIIDKTKEYQDELIKLQRIGGTMTEAVGAGALQSQAFDIQKRVPMKVEDLLKIPGMTYSILRGDMGEVQQTWEPLAKFGYVQRSNKDFHGDVTKEVGSALRAGELTGRITDKEGQIDIQKLHEWLDFVAKTTAATHGMVNGETLLGMAKQGGFTMRGLDEKGMATMAEMGQAMGGQRAGTAYMSLWQQQAAGTMFTRTAEGLQDLGFLKPGEWHTDHGRVVINDEASKRLTSTISKDPMVFAQQIKKAMEEHGITDQDDQMRQIMRMLNRQTTQRFMGEMYSNMNQQLAERGILLGGSGVDESMKEIKDKSLTANMEALSTAWHNLMVAVAGPQSQNEIGILQQLTGAIQTMTGFANVNPEAVKIIGEGIAAVAVALGAIGVVTLVAIGGIPAAIAAAVAAAATLAALNWQSIKAMFEGIGAAISGFIDYIISLYGKIKDLLGLGGGLGVDKGGSHTSPGKTGMPAKPMRFIPGTDQPKATPVTLSLNVDGRTLAQAVSEQMASLTGYPTGGPTPDGSDRFASGDHNFADV